MKLRRAPELDRTVTWWLRPGDRARLARGDFDHYAMDPNWHEHDAVLVSIPGQRPALIDPEIAELVYLLNWRHDITTVESCQGDSQHGVYLLFAGRSDFRRFVELLHRAHCGAYISASLMVEKNWFGRGHVQCEFPHRKLADLTRLVRNA